MPACYIQPLNALLAGTTLTETYTAFYLIAAILLVHSGRMGNVSFRS